jgi:hypothetical protein
MDKVKALLYECLPVRPQDASRLGRWLVVEQVSLLRLLVNLILVVLRVVKALLKRYWLHLVVFFSGLHTADSYGLGQLWLVLAGFAGIFLNLRDGKRAPGELSAYHILNEGYRRIAGDLDPDQIDRQLRRGG